MTKFTTAELRLSAGLQCRGAMVATPATSARMRALASDPRRSGDKRADPGQEIRHRALFGVPCVSCPARPCLRGARCGARGTLPRDVALLIDRRLRLDTDRSGCRQSRQRRTWARGGCASWAALPARSWSICARPARANRHNIDILKHCVADFAQEDMLLIVEF
jgi:tagatose 1,6-diphosphate aldolase